jgi:hypothetical protein
MPTILSGRPQSVSANVLPVSQPSRRIQCLHPHAKTRRILFIHKVAPHLWKKEFEAKLEGIIDEVALLLVIQKNLLEIEMVCTPYIDYYPRQSKYFCQ